MVEIRLLRHLRREDLQVTDGYMSTAKYRVRKAEIARAVCFTLDRQELSEPFENRWTVSEEDFRRYGDVVGQGMSFAAYDGESTVGVAIADTADWNRSLWIREFGIAKPYRRQGLGRRLMERVAQHASKEGFRVLVCETQTTNVPAIDFYRSVGFEVGGIDLSYYSNDDVQAGEVALFLKRKLE
jgi:ribosomal protein S18 acetylase RimI-like enzyme